jgi:hypothetical protein
MNDVKTNNNAPATPNAGEQDKAKILVPTQQQGQIPATEGPQQQGQASKAEAPQQAKA